MNDHSQEPGNCCTWGLEELALVMPFFAHRVMNLVIYRKIFGCFYFWGLHIIFQQITIKNLESHYKNSEDYRGQFGRDDICNILYQYL